MTEIEAALNGLRYPVKVKGQTDKPMTLQARMAYYKVPGVSIAVVDQGNIIWAKGFGVTDVDTHKPVDENTLFQACSISKVTAAVGLMLLVQQGKVDLDTDVNTYLKRWKVPKKIHTRSNP
ncbi:serine hydrolase domain-containing protein [Geitlerinema splendidum]|nr:serine hydrolase domain-containing protein [Geitlerinema splendidum]